MNQNHTIDTNLLRQIFFIAIILALGLVLFFELWFFLSAFLGAITFYVIMRQRMFYLTEKKRMEAEQGCMGIVTSFIFCYPGSYRVAGKYYVLQGELCSYTLIRPVDFFKNDS